MEFSIKGLTFNQSELVEISLLEIPVNSISRFHFFHIIGRARKCMLLLRAGELITSNFIQKYTEKGVKSLYALEVASEEKIFLYQNLWKELENAKSQSRQIEIKDEILFTFMQENTAESQSSILSFVTSCFNEFYQLPPQLIEKYQETSYLLFTRSLILSSFTTVSSMAHGISDYSFLKDFFNTALFLDYGLCESGQFNYSLSRACELERESPGQGLFYLKDQSRPDTEIQLFINHPKQSVHILDNYRDKFLNSEVIHLIKFHHEKADGSGFPQGLYYSGLSETEMLLAFCDNLVPFQEHIFSRGDGYLFVSMYFENLSELVKSKMIPVKGIIESWKSIIQWNKREEEKVS